MPIRWRLTIFNALIMGAILLVVFLPLYFLLGDALLSRIEDTAKSRAMEIARDVEEEPGDDLLDEDEAEELALDRVFAVVRDAEGCVLTRTVELESDEGENDSVWREALESGQATGGTAELIEQDASDYVYAVPVSPPTDRPV